MVSKHIIFYMQSCVNIGVSMLLTSSNHSENHIISTYKDVSRKVSEAITQKYLMSAVSRFLPLSGDMTSELEKIVVLLLTP